MQLPAQPSEERITLRSIADYLLELINLERGLGYTVRRLLSLF